MTKKKHRTQVDELIEAGQVERENCLSEWLIFLAEHIEGFGLDIHRWETATVQDNSSPYWPAVSAYHMQLIGETRKHLINTSEQIAEQVSVVLASIERVVQPVANREGEALWNVTGSDPDERYHAKLKPLAEDIPERLLNLADQARGYEQSKRCKADDVDTPTTPTTAERQAIAAMLQAKEENPDLKTYDQIFRYITKEGVVVDGEPYRPQSFQAWTRAIRRAKGKQ